MKIALTPQSEGGFPELKVLKQRIRDSIQPEKHLGHSEGHPAIAKSAGAPGMSN